jgi:hypothetical protein
VQRERRGHPVPRGLDCKPAFIDLMRRRLLRDLAQPPIRSVQSPGIVERAGAVYCGSDPRPAGCSSAMHPVTSG